MDERVSESASKESGWKSCGGGWSINLVQGKVEHESGFSLEFSGHPNSQSFEIQPSGAPGTLGAVEWASLLREGADIYRNAFGDEAPPAGGDWHEAPKRPARKPVITVKRKRQIG